MLTQWEYDNGVYGIAVGGPGGPMIDAHHRLIGDEGVIEIGASEAATDLRVRRTTENGRTSTPATTVSAASPTATRT